jgi:hypothetical protein
VRLPLLGGELQLRGIEGLQTQASQSDILTSIDDEIASTLVLAEGPKLLTVHARQLFRSLPNDFHAALEKVAPPGSSIEVSHAPGVLRAWVVPAAPVDDGHDAELLLSAYTGTENGLLQEVDVLANKATLGASGGCVPFAKTLLSALEAGNGKLELTPGTRHFQGHSLSVPKDVAMVSERGPDFSVFHFYPILAFGAPNGEALIYIGAFPEPFDPHGTAVKGRAFGSPRTWRERVTEERVGDVVTRTWTRRTVVALSHDSSADLSVEARDEAVFHSLSAMLETTL